MQEVFRRICLMGIQSSLDICLALDLKLNCVCKEAVRRSSAGPVNNTAVFHGTLMQSSR
jgi:hypothetical protein